MKDLTGMPGINASQPRYLRTRYSDAHCIVTGVCMWIDNSISGNAAHRSGYLGRGPGVERSELDPRGLPTPNLILKEHLPEAQ